MSLKALLFDLDGTLVDTDPVHLAVFAEILAPLGHHVDDAFFRKYISGGRNEEILPRFFPELDEDEIRRRGDAKEARFRELASQVAPVEGVYEVIAWARQQGLSVGLVTNAPRENVDFVLPVLKLEDAFDIQILGSEMEKGKPDPAPYKAALEAFAINADEAIVFEDSKTGIISAKGAGIFTYGLMTTHTETELVDAGADIAIRDYRDQHLWVSLEEKLK
ncbi:HAD-IA family hydrolase [Microvirga sp. W0021]|uniref:HAD-IA family hydrolase n=1 Tax=Hohaiivirga grylli TaxID=3133970 RepID=A0ABV0BJ26_9HYPH